MQTALVRAILAAGTPVVLVVVSGHPYALDEFAASSADIVQAACPGVTTLDPTPLFAFGHGLSYTTVDYLGIEASHDAIDVTATVEVAVTVRSTGARECIEVVQLYASDLVAQVARPVIELIGFSTVTLAPGQLVTLTFEVHADRLSFTGIEGTRSVEPGTVSFSAGRSSENRSLAVDVDFVGECRTIPGVRQMLTPVCVDDAY